MVVSGGGDDRPTRISPPTLAHTEKGPASALPEENGGRTSVVELRGLEPLTPTLPVWCATSCAIAPFAVVKKVTSSLRTRYNVPQPSLAVQTSR